MLDFRMATFLAVCRHLNYTRAAAELSITQPAVSQHIRHLEEYYGTALFVKKGKRIRLTAAGQEVRAAALAMAHDDRLLRSKLRTAPEEKRLRFGVTLTVGDFVIPEAMGRYLRAHPEAKISMAVANTQELLCEVDDGDIDFALVEGYFSKKEYEHLVYSTEPYVAVCAAEHRFVHPPKAVEDLLLERLLVREAGSGTREILERYLEGKNLKLDDFAGVEEIGSLHAIKRLVRMDCGIAFFYEAAVREELRAGTMRKIELPEFVLRHDLTFLWRKGSLFADEYRAVFEELRGGA